MNVISATTRETHTIVNGLSWTRSG